MPWARLQLLVIADNNCAWPRTEASRQSVAWLALLWHPNNDVLLSYLLAVIPTALEHFEVDLTTLSNSRQTPYQNMTSQHSLATTATQQFANGQDTCHSAAYTKNSATQSLLLSGSGWPLKLMENKQYSPEILTGSVFDVNIRIEIFGPICYFFDFEQQ